MKRAGFLFVLSLIVAAAYAQMEREDRPMMPQGEMADMSTVCFFEAINLAADDSVVSRVDIPYRIDTQFLVAVRNTDPALPFPFRRRAEVLIELLDKDGASKARNINRIDMGARSTRNDQTERSWYQGIASFNVAPGEYTVVVEIDDLESERRFLDRKRMITAQKFDGAKLRSSTLLLVEPMDSSRTLIPINFGGSLAFGKSAALFLQLHGNAVSSAPVRVEYSISTLPFFAQEAKVVFADTIPQLALLSQSNISLMPETESPRYVLSDSKSAAIVAAMIPIPAEKLPLRPMVVRMKISQGDAEVKLDQNIRMIWPEMPASLRDVDFALDALRHITHPEELDSLKSGSRDLRLAHLEGFWRSKDRTPDTEYNEVMVEYYRRVDHVQRTFSSMKGLDGFKSDRGRIYILHGPPSRTERTLDPAAGYQEVWYYDGKNKKFLFVDQSKNGNYTLVSAQNP